MYKVPLFFDLISFYFLEARAEILTKIRWFFGRFESTKGTFWNQLTFTKDIRFEYWIDLLESEGAQKNQYYPRIDLNPLQGSSDVSFISIHVKL